MSIVAQFPHELLDLILVHHSEDSACLKACSLVCRAWFFSSRSLLFRTCILRPRNIRTFRALLLSPDCTILPHVRKLDVFRNWFHDDDGCFNEVAKEMRHHCRHIHSLQMGLFLDHEASEAQLDAFLCQGFITAFTHITSLELTCDYYGRDSLASPLLDMLCLFYDLQALHMRGIYGALAEPQTFPAPPPGLRSLVLGETSVGLILRWFLRTGRLGHLKSLSLPRVRRIDVQTVREALPQLGNLHHLSIELTRTFRVDVYSMYNLLLHPNLRTLSIRDSSRPQSWTSSNAQFNPNSMSTLIRGLAAPALESFSLELDLQLYRNLDWAALDAFLSPARFPRLRKVTVACRRRHNSDSLFLCNALPLLEASGVLRTVR